MRRFYLQRVEDVHGVSGEGRVADGVEFSPGGVAVIRWRSKVASTAVFETGMRAVEAVHGHEGRTRIVWIDETALDVRGLVAGRFVIVVAGDMAQAVEWARENGFAKHEVRYAVGPRDFLGYGPDRAVVVRCGTWYERQDYPDIEKAIRSAELELL